MIFFIKENVLCLKSQPPYFNSVIRWKLLFFISQSQQNQILSHICHNSHFSRLDVFIARCHFVFFRIRKVLFFISEPPHWATRWLTIEDDHFSDDPATVGRVVKKTTSNLEGLSQKGGRLMKKSNFHLQILSLSTFQMCHLHVTAYVTGINKVALFDHTHCQMVLQSLKVIRPLPNKVTCCDRLRR